MYMAALWCWAELVTRMWKIVDMSRRSYVAPSDSQWLSKGVVRAVRQALTTH